MENGTFISNNSLKHLIKGKIRIFRGLKWAEKAQSSLSLKRIDNILGGSKEYFIWNLCKQFPKYLPLAQKAVRMLARLFSVK